MPLFHSLGGGGKSGGGGGDMRQQGSKLSGSPRNLKAERKAERQDVSGHSLRAAGVFSNSRTDTTHLSALRGSCPWRCDGTGPTRDTEEGGKTLQS